MMLKNKLIASALPLVLFSSTTSIALAETVHYKGTPVYWEHGNFSKIRSYSNVQTHHYTHSSTANGVWSGWKKKGITAKVSTWISPTKKATAYWDCK